MALRLDWTSHFAFNPAAGPVAGAPLTWLPPGGMEDVITLTVSPASCDPGVVEIGLTSEAGGNPVRWWKGLRLMAPNGVQLGVSETQDDSHAGARMLFEAGQLGNKRLEIWKAKFLGIHTCMYDLPLAPLASWGGSRFVFHWFKDNGPNG